MKFLKKIEKLNYFIKGYIKIFLYSFKFFFLSSEKKSKFRSDFEILKNKLLRNENFAFSRFSDGELFVIKNKTLKIDLNFAKIDNKIYSGSYTQEEKKEFIPKRDQKQRRLLIQSLKFKKKNYFKGISCTCCNGIQDTTLMKKISNDQNFNTFSNLFINKNYIKYIKEIVPIFKKKKIILIVSKEAKLNSLPFKIKKTFRVGENCFINDLQLIPKIKKYIKKNNIENHLFLISAASLSNLIIHQLYKNFDKNTYIDIGSSLNPFFKMKGWIPSRVYLMEYWLDQKPQIFLKKSCYW